MACSSIPATTPFRRGSFFIHSEQSVYLSQCRSGVTGVAGIPNDAPIVGPVRQSGRKCRADRFHAFRLFKRQRNRIVVLFDGLLERLDLLADE
jgi:hypothetical protein